jgi:MacB-like periplasmic core domain
MRFVLNMAGREIRGSGGRLLVFFFCIAIGVASMVSVRSFTDRLAASTARDARALVAADVRIDTPDLEQPGLRDRLARFTSSPLVIDYTEIVETQTMARVTSNGDVRPVLVELRGVRKEFPLHGAVHLSSGGSYSYAMLADQGAVVSPALLSRLGITIGDSVQIGDLSVVIRGTADRIREVNRFGRGVGDDGSLANLNVPKAQQPAGWDSKRERSSDGRAERATSPRTRARRSASARGDGAVAWPPGPSTPGSATSCIPTRLAFKTVVCPCFRNSRANVRSRGWPISARTGPKLSLNSRTF